MTEQVSQVLVDLGTTKCPVPLCVWCVYVASVQQTTNDYTRQSEIKAISLILSTLFLVFSVLLCQHKTIIQGRLPVIAGNN